MPVRSLNSAVFRCPDRKTVLAAARQWATRLRREDPSVEQIACVGSYARGDWGVGSDLDVIIILSETDLSREDRYRKYYPDDLPVPVDLWVYTKVEWDALSRRAAGLWGRISRELVSLCEGYFRPS